MAGLGLEDVRLEDVVLMTVQEAGRTGRLAAQLPFIIPTRSMVYKGHLYKGHS